MGGAAVAGMIGLAPAEAWATSAACPQGRVRCAGRCCPTGEVCLPANQAHPRRHCGCPHHTTRCGTHCVNLHTSAQNCGSCGHACGQGQVCQSGQCVTKPCPSGQTNCGGKCVDLQSDFNNCGGCGTPCSDYFANSSCVNGQCVINSCSPNWINCSGNPRDGCNCLGTTCNGTMCGG